MLDLLQVQWLQKHLILGLVSSAAAGTEDIGRASCEALVSFLLALSETSRASISKVISDVLLQQLSISATTDDRHVVPTMEFLAFLLEQHLLSHDPSNAVGDIWNVMETVNAPPASIQRLETITKIYSALCVTERHKTRAVDKLTRLLLHRYPKVSCICNHSIVLCSTLTNVN